MSESIKELRKGGEALPNEKEIMGDHTSDRLDQIPLEESMRMIFTLTLFSSCRGC